MNHYKIFFILFVALALYSCEGYDYEKDNPLDKIAVTDIDGNQYHAVPIGSQVWLVENLKTTRYRNGDPIPNVTDSVAWSNLTTGAYCNYDNDTNNGNIYGRLYNWYAVNDGRGLALEGWHVATDSDWIKLAKYLDNVETAGKKLKSKIGWYEDGNGTDEYGFTALPGGLRITGGSSSFDFLSIGISGMFWASTEHDLTSALCKYLEYGNDYLNYWVENKKVGMSIRCVKNVGELPAVTTIAVTSVTGQSASCGGNVTSDGGDPVTARGVCWSTQPNPTTKDSKTLDSSGTGTFTSAITGLTYLTKYYVRAYATNNNGTAYGNPDSFTTITGLPNVTTNAISYLTYNSADCGGNVITDGGAVVTARGVCWSTAQNPTIADYKTTDGSGTGSFTSALTGLSPNTTYYIRAYATNSAGTGYGNEVFFKTYNSTVTDIDGNVYYTIIIGTQEWMAENLKTTHFRNGEAIPNITAELDWSYAPPAYCNYNNDTSNGAIYGRLYNYSAVSDGRNIAPTGWHVPSDIEWTILTTYLGGESVAGGKLKETGYAHWANPNNGATNVTSFTALPGGYRYENGYFDNIGIVGNWWSSNESSSANAWERGMPFDNAYVYRGSTNKSRGFSVRCVKD